MLFTLFGVTSGITRNPWVIPEVTPKWVNNTNVHSKFTLISLFSKIHSLKSEHIHSFLFREYLIIAYSVLLFSRSYKNTLSYDSLLPPSLPAPTPQFLPLFISHYSYVASLICFFLTFFQHSLTPNPYRVHCTLVIISLFCTLSSDSPSTPYP